jgi:hypothetical protein
VGYPPPELQDLSRLLQKNEEENEMKNYICPKCLEKQFKVYFATDNKVGLNKLSLVCDNKKCDYQSKLIEVMR